MTMLLSSRMRPLFGLLLLILASPAAAQQVDEQLWLQANAATEVGKEATLTLESIARFGDRADGLAHTEFGGLASWRPSKAIEIGGGYRHVQDYDHDRRIPNEERLREQVTVQIAGGFATRLRFEQRFSSAGPEVGMRVRGQLRFTLPFGNRGVAAFAAHESFIDLNRTDWGQQRGYERMRHSLGLQFPLAKRLRAEAGYLNQYRFGRHGARDQMDHAATFTTTLNF